MLKENKSKEYFSSDKIDKKWHLDVVKKRLSGKDKVFTYKKISERLDFLSLQ